MSSESPTALQRIGDWLKKQSSSFLAILVLAALALAPFGAISLLSDGDEDDGAALQTDTPPAEYLYLDNARVLAYLSQFEGGAFQSETRTFTETNELKTEAKAGDQFTVGASAQRQRSIERQVVANAAGNYFRLLEHLLDEEAADASFEFEPSIDLGDDAHFDLIQEGDLVRIETTKLRRPGYLNPYLTVRQSGTLKALFPKAPEAREQARAFARKIGPNPRFTFAIGRNRDQRYLLPVEYESLSDERGLFSGGQLTIVGKVIRLFEAPAGEQAASSARYVDDATRETWTFPLKSVPPSLLEKAPPNCAEEEVQGEACLLRKLRRQTNVRTTGAVIIPLAIYK